MRTVSLCVALAAITLAAQTIQVSGRVLTSDGKPIDAAQVSIAAAAPRATPTETVTNAQGAFTIENLPTGRYTLSVAKPGFIVYRSQLAQSQTSMEIRLGLASTITGRATDADGNPLPKALITAYRYTYTRGARSLNPAGYTIGTNADGVYTFPNLTAGRYYLRVEAAPPGVTTYYPSTLDPAAAAAVDVDTGATRSGIEIRQLKAPVFHIRGKAVTESGEPAPNTSLRIIAEQPIETLAPPPPPAMAADGSFEFKDLLPGRYVIRAIPNGNVMVAGQLVPAKFSARTNVTVTGDVDDFRLIVKDGGHSLAGRIRMEDDSALPIPPPPAVQPPPGFITLTGLRARLTDAEQTFTMGDLSAAAAPEGGAFRIDNIVSGKYYVSVNPLPPNVYIKSIRLGGQDLTRSPIDLMYGGANLEIVLGAKGGTVNATVRNAKGEPVPRVQVALWPRQPDAGTPASSIRVSMTDDNGSVRFAGLRPEKYFLAAFADAEQAFVRSPDFLDRFRARAAELDVRDGASVERTLEPVSREDAATAIRNLP